MACAGSETTGQYNFSAMRERMVETQIRARDLQSATVLDAMRRVPRHLFVPDDLKPFAYDDRPLPIGHDQTISQPYIVAYMTDALQLEPAHTVLEIGTGSGYQAAILADIARQVYSIEIVPDLAESARRAIAAAGYTNVEVRAGNGYLGWRDHAPFDRIIVTAAPPDIPDALVEQLAVGGVMVLPVGTANQEIVVITKTPAGIAQKRTRFRSWTIKETCEIFSPLEYLMERECENLSGGEMQMVAIARALVGAPGLILFDEPSQGLAPKIVGDVLATIRRLRDEGVASLVVEQNAEIALSVADHAAVIDRGRIAWTGEAAVLRDDRGLRQRLLGVH